MAWATTRKPSTAFQRPSHSTNGFRSPFEWDDYEKAVKLERSEEQLQENYFDPAAAAMAQEFDSRCAKFAYQNASNVVGVLGTDPTAVSTYFSARQRLMEKACPPGNRCMNISPRA
jgi:hypothetical protein